MKRVINFSIWAVLLALCVGFTSCSDDNDDRNDTTYIKAKVNGEDYSANVATVVMDGGLGAKASISSVSFNDEPIIMISFPEGTSKGTYEITEDYFDDFGAAYDSERATSGTIIITEFDETKNIVKGTFEFIAGTYIVTDGEFVAEMP